MASLIDHPQEYCLHLLHPKCCRCINMPRIFVVLACAHMRASYLFPNNRALHKGRKARYPQDWRGLKPGDQPQGGDQSWVPVGYKEVIKARSQQV